MIRAATLKQATASSALPVSLRHRPQLTPCLESSKCATCVVHDAAETKCYTRAGYSLHMHEMIMH